MANLLITGVNGFIGSHLAEKMLESGHTVKGLIRKTSNLHFIEGMNLELFTGDITDPSSLDAAMTDTEVVIHNAGLASDWGPFSRFYEVNVQGSLHVAEAAARAGVRRLVYMSSTAIHGFGNPKAMNETDAPRKTIYPYNESKRIAEEKMLAFGKSSGMEIIAIRPGNVYGERDHTFMQKYLDAMKSGKIGYVSGGESRTCPTYVRNLAEAVLLAAFQPGISGESFIITDGLEINWKEFTNRLALEMQVKAPRLSIPFAAGYSLAAVSEALFRIVNSSRPPLFTRYRMSNGGLDYFFSIEKAKQMLGFSPAISLEEAIRRTVDWYRQI